MKKSRSKIIIGLLLSAVFAFSMLAPNNAYAEESSDQAEAGKYTLSFNTSFSMCEVYYHIQNSDGQEISSGSVDELSTSVEGWKTYERDIWLEEAPATIWFSGRCKSSYPGSSGEMPVCLEDTEPAEFKECSDVTITNYSSILDTDYNWGSYSIKKYTDTENQGRLLSGDELDQTVIRMKPSFGLGKALSIATNGYSPVRQNVVHLYNIGDSSRFLLTKADDDSYYIDFYDGSGHYDVHDKRFDIDDANGYDTEGNKVHVVTGNRTAMNKRWQFIQRPNGYYLVRNKESGLYWALEKQSTKNGTDLVQKSLNNCHTWQMEILNCFDTSKKVNQLKKYDTLSYMESADGAFNSCNWMSYLPDDINITDVSIPGSHDAGTAKTTTHLNSSAQCQQHTIQEQLNAGVRYFDIRIEKKGDDDIYLTHNGIDCFMGDDHLKFSTVMDWVDTFLDENPSETVIFQIMVQKGGKDGEKITLNRMKDWDRVYRGENWKDPVMPELGDLRGKVMFISRFSKIDDINQGTFRDGDKWFGLDAQKWKQDKDGGAALTAYSTNHEIWTQDKYDMSGASKMDWVDASLFDPERNAVYRRNDLRNRGKKGLIINYTSCTQINPQSAARYVHEDMLPLLQARNGRTDPFMGVVCNDFIDEELSWLIYSKNFRGINVTIRGMDTDGKIVAKDLNYYFAPGTSVGNFFTNEGNAKVVKNFTIGGYEPLCYGGGIPMYLDSKPSSFGDDWAAMSEAEVSLYGISTNSGNYILYVPLIKADENNAKVTFDVAGHGSAPEPVDVKKGSWLFDVPTPAAEGYTFGGWYLDAEYSRPFDESEPIYEDMTLHAKWTKGHTITVKVGFPGDVEKPDSLSLTSYAHIPASDPAYVTEEITLNRNNDWTGTFSLDPEESLHIWCKDELKYDWYLFTEKGEMSLKVHGNDGLQDNRNCIKLDFDDHEGSNPNWTDRQWKAAYDSVVNGTAEIRMVYSNHYHAKMTWDSGDNVDYTSCMYDASDPTAGTPVIEDESDPWEKIMLDQGEAHEVVLEHRETSSNGETIWKTVEAGKIYDHERDGVDAWTCAFDTPIVDKRANYRVRLKVNNRTERDYGSQYILSKGDGKEKLIYDADDGDAKAETNAFSFVFKDPRQDINESQRPGHRRTFKVTYGTDDQGNFTVHNERIGDFTAEVKWNLPGKYKSLKPEGAVELKLDSKEGSQWNTAETQTLSEENGWYTRFTKGQWENVDDVRDHYRVMLGSSSDGNTVSLPVMDGEDQTTAEFTVGYDTSDGYHYVVSLTLKRIHTLDHVSKKDPTCTEEGNIEYWHCTECDGYFDDAEAQQEITEEDTIIKAAGHTWGSWEITTEPTEEQDGTETRTCEKCGATQTRNVPFEYDLRKVDANPATCKEEGNIEYWVYDKSGKLFMDDSGQIEIHEGDVIIPAQGHEWSEWTRVTETDNVGIHHIDSRACLRDGCGEKEVFDYYENHTHELELQDEIPATCSDTGIREHYMCSKCGQLFDDKEGKIAIVDDGEDVPEADRKTIEEKLALPVDPNAHVWAECNVEKEPTCTEPGEMNCVCLYNEAHTETEDIEPTGHKWNGGTVTKKAITTQTGTRVYTCTVCGQAKTVTIAKLAKKANPLKVGAKTATVKYKKLKKKTQKLAVTKVIRFTKKGRGKMSYKLVSAKKGSKSFKKYFKISKKTGKVTIKKNRKMKKGIYKVRVKVKALGNANYKASAWKTVTFKVRVK